VIFLKKYKFLPNPYIIIAFGLHFQDLQTFLQPHFHVIRVTEDKVTRGEFNLEPAVTEKTEIKQHREVNEYDLNFSFKDRINMAVKKALADNKKELNETVVKKPMG
jgi:hypothetical protein